MEYLEPEKDLPKIWGCEPGFEEFMAIMADKSHPKYEAMKIWSEGLSEKDKTIEEINQWLGF